jgi:phosphate-selective porin OprO/OprP
MTWTTTQTARALVLAGLLLPAVAAAEAQDSGKQRTDATAPSTAGGTDQAQAVPSATSATKAPDAKNPGAKTPDASAAGASAPVAKAPDAPAKPADVPKIAAGAEGFALQSSSGDFKLQLRGYVQLDGRFFTTGSGPLTTDTFVLRRVRPIFAGTVGRHFEFQIMPDFGGGQAMLQDAWLDVNYSPKLRVRVGKFKSPVGLELLQSDASIAFVERAAPSFLVPNRDVGLMLHGELAGGIVAYAAGVFDGAPDGGSVDLDLNDQKDVAGRLFLSPFKRGSSVLKDLGFGIAGTTGRQSGALPGYRSVSQVNLLAAAQGVTADGTRRRFSPQLSYYVGPFGLIAEYAWSESWVKKPSDGTRVRFNGKAWEATATFALTGEKASYSGLRPKEALDPGQGKWGAIELTARAHAIEFGDDVFDLFVDPAKTIKKGLAWAVGLNWYLSRNVKQVVDYERMTFTGGAADGKDRPTENAFYVRTQLAF